MRMTENTAKLPGAELVLPGLRDLERRIVSRESLVVSLARHALVDLGYEVGRPLPLADGPEAALYHLLAETEGDNAHSAYQALVRRLSSFLRAS